MVSTLRLRLRLRLRQCCFGQWSRLKEVGVECSVEPCSSNRPSGVLFFFRSCSKHFEFQQRPTIECSYRMCSPTLPLQSTAIPVVESTHTRLVIWGGLFVVTLEVPCTPTDQKRDPIERHPTLWRKWSTSPRGWEWIARNGADVGMIPLFFEVVAERYGGLWSGNGEEKVWRWHVPWSV